MIQEADSIMRVLTIDHPDDSLILRTPCTDFSAEALLSPEYSMLCSLMVATVTHPSQDGVGIAGPQVGLGRRVVAVQRFDKEPVSWGGRKDYPFEVYPNIRIVWKSDSLAVGGEGCLSVPDRRGEVLRSTEIVIEYADLEAFRTQACGSCGLLSDTDEPEATAASGSRKENRGMRCQGDIPMVRDTVRGFTAVIFQHETDHLDGVLYIDRIRFIRKSS